MPDARVLLRGIRWDTYERLLDELENRNLRLTYDRGELEIMAPSHRHESYKRLLGRLVETMTLELGVPIKSGGSTTFKRRDLEKGLEPDECYWVRHEPAVRDRVELDLLVDPAPDLVVEAEASRSILDRLGILAALGVDEVWRYDGRRLVVLLREDGDYVESRTSRCFPWLPVDAFAEHVARPRDVDETTWLRAFRDWVRQAIRIG